ncbi:recombinase family protein [Mycobacteroides abscessus subsp. abscessus]|uniref:recombinase family protein n=1 Tax=Mycobacteroides abscessus TaxID=36809 RepID=UPI0009415F97|nr:recombinase family protein [Mycobacteroides abscessus]MBN7403657.1 recombinase family protein [Mycobacteroides abscessus subsp. abscessus]MDO3087215.1 recombinase family protein [Mycobacteroides abscessus subsp. abscessus]MDO3269195.1 recombinase family protein [Mycobacteroides abscessus subsp. abscessus]
MAGQSTAQVTQAIIYARVSSDKAAGRSVEEQEHECRAECERRAWPVAHVLTDNDLSASRFATKDRPEYKRLRDLLAPGDVLVTWEASRAQRDLARYVELRDLCAERGVRWSYSGRLFDLTDGDDRFATGLDALLAEKEAEQTRVRILRAHRANLAEGKPHGRVPYGYRIVRDPDTGKAVGRVVDPVRGPLVAEAARRVLDGQSLASMVRWIATKDPDPKWNEAKLRRILVNPTTAGYRTHSITEKGKRGPQVIHGEGTWEPIITREQHADLVALFATRKSGPRGSEPRHLLSGIVTCGVCENYLWLGKGGRKKDGSHYDVYSCQNRHAARNKQALDEVITSVIEGMLASPEALAALAAPPPDPSPSAVAELEELKRQLRGVEDQMAENKMPADVGARVATRLTERIAASEAAAAPVYTEPIVRELATAPDPVALWRSLALPQKREFIRAVMTVKIERVGRGRWHAKEAGIIITPRSKTSTVTPA